MLNVIISEATNRLPQRSAHSARQFLFSLLGVSISVTKTVAKTSVNYQIFSHVLLEIRKTDWFLHCNVMNAFYSLMEHACVAL